MTSTRTVSRALPQVSVVIPFYQSADFIGTCLKSLKTQTHTDYEVICVDDGSSDDSARIVASHASVDPRITLVRQTHRGAGIARNTGLRHARGKWVYFLDSDDWIVPLALERLVSEGERHRADVVYFNGVGNPPAGWKLLSSWRRTRLAHRCFTGQKYLHRAVKARAFRFSPCLQFLNRSFLEKASLSFPDDSVGEDVLFSVQVVLAARRAVYLPEGLFNRNLREGSLTTATPPISSLRSSLSSMRQIRQLARGYQHSPATLQALRRTTNRLFDNAVGYFDLLPASARMAIRPENLLGEDRVLSVSFLTYAKSNKFARTLKRTLRSYVRL